MVQSADLRHFLVAVRYFSEKYFGLHNSMITFDVMLRVLGAYADQKKITTADLARELPYSVLSIRSHVRKLESKNFLRFIEDSGDRRLRSILPTEDFLKKYVEFSVAVLDHDKH